MPDPRHYQHLDEQLAAICAWLKANGRTMHVSIRGDVELRRKVPKP